MDARYVEHALHTMPSSPSQREALRRSVMIDTGNRRVLFRARHFLAGVLIGAALWLPVFLAMD